MGTLSKNDLFNSISGLASVLGFFLSLWLWYLTGTIRKQVNLYAIKLRFKDDKKSIKEQILANLQLMKSDHIVDRAIKTDTMRLVGHLDTYRQTFSIADRFRLWQVKRILGYEALCPKDVTKIATKMSYILGKLEAGEEDIDV